MINEDMRDLFFIIKGRYCKKKPLMNYGDNDYYIGAFNPEDFETVEWYRVLDRNNNRCIHAGVSLDKALNSIRREIIRCKDLRGYNNSLSGFSERKNQKLVDMENLIDEEYGYYYREMIRDVEDEAYEFLTENTDVKKAKRRFRKIDSGVVSEKPQREKENAPKKMVLHRIKSVR